ncbi:Scr1 family TA system antitoxin-like transcriptional regulator [Streptomyces sp. NPDC101219]|uniref:Scr1 family TA system antitoxin-like transcriptional regulator n=1 Tax=Streptomyces sp. NPDC101219 TaxID=3366131 RepID=UPI0038269216
MTGPSSGWWVTSAEDQIEPDGFAAHPVQRLSDGTSAPVVDQQIEDQTLPHITLLVIPFSVGAFHGAGQSVLYVEGPVPQLDTVQLDTALGATFVDAPTPVANYRSLLDLMERTALPADASRKLIRFITREL